MNNKSGEIPQGVTDDVAGEFEEGFGSQKEAWNSRFNNLADKLDVYLASTSGSLGSTQEGDSQTKRLAALFFENLLNEEYSAIQKLVELAAKATGGRTPR